jgi:hypothetical protein
MTPSWYGQHGLDAAAPRLPQPPNRNIQHARYLHNDVSVPGPAMAHGGAVAYSRSSPPMNRPPSSASTSSTSSYHTAPQGPAPGPVPGLSHFNAHGAPTGPMQRPVAFHPHHGGSAGRYPMPPRNGTLQHPRPMNGIPQSLRHQHMPHPQGNMRRHSPVGPGTQGPAPRGMPNNSPKGHLQSHHPHHAPMQPPSNLRPGHLHVHHPDPYRRTHPMLQAGAPHPPNHRMNYPPAHHPQTHPVDAAHMHRQRYGSPNHQAVSQSPSPPPAPPAQEYHGRPAPLAPNATTDRVLSDGSFGPLKERKNIQGGQLQKHTFPLKTPTVDMTADAASILLELRSVMGQDGKDSNSNNEENDAPKTQDSAKTMEVENQPSTDDDAKMTLQCSTSCDTEQSCGSVPTLESDCAPDLTSEPSADSTETTSSDFPCAYPENFPTRLALPHDEEKLNSLHCYLRSELLEIFVVQKSRNKSPTHSPGSSVGRVGLRCVHCAMVRKTKEDRDEAPMAVFYPKSVAEIYRLVTSWQRCHLRKCRNLPPPVRSKWQALRDNDKSRGKTHYWVASAKEIGLLDCQSRAGGVRFANEDDKKNTIAKSEPVKRTPGTAFVHFPKSTGVHLPKRLVSWIVSQNTSIKSEPTTTNIVSAVVDDPTVAAV